MIKKLVLVRHGKAQPISAAASDFDRELLPAGERALRHAYPRTFALLDDDDDVRIWSSPAARALGTAEVIGEVLGIDPSEFELFDTIYEQDFDATLASILASDEETVVLVGHIPLVEDLAARLGYNLSFETGAAACISMPKASGVPRLLWFVQGPKVKKLS